MNAIDHLEYLTNLISSDMKKEGLCGFGFMWATCGRILGYMEKLGHIWKKKQTIKKRSIIRQKHVVELYPEI